MRKSIIFGIVGVVSFLTLTGFAIGHHGMCKFRHNHAKIAKFINWKVNDTLDDLKATDTQRAQILAIKDRLLLEAKTLHDAKEATHEEVLKQLNSNQPNANQLHSLADKRIDDFRQFIHKAVDALVEVHSILTPDQRAKLESEIEQMHPSY